MKTLSLQLQTLFNQRELIIKDNYPFQKEFHFLKPLLLRPRLSIGIELREW